MPQASAPEPVGRKSDNAALGLFAALGDSLVRQLRSWHGDWSSSEGKEIISNFDFVRRGLLEGRQLTSEDLAEATYLAYVNGGTKTWNPERAARYLESLLVLLNIAVPPSQLSVTAH